MILIWPQREHGFTPNGSTGQGSVVGWAHNLRECTVTKLYKEYPPHLALGRMRGPLEASPCDCVLLYVLVRAGHLLWQNRNALVPRRQTNKQRPKALAARTLPWPVTSCDVITMTSQRRDIAAEAVKNKPGSLGAWRSHKTGLLYVAWHI